MLNFDDGRVAALDDERVNGMDENIRIRMEVSVKDIKRAVKKLKKGKTP